MSRKQPIPRVDAAALAALAGQFPSSSPRTAEPVTDGKAPAPRSTAPLTDSKASRTQGNKATKSVEPVSGAAPAASARKPPGRGLAVGALMLAFVAVLIAVSAVLAPTARQWLTRHLGDTDIVNIVTGNRADIDRRMAATAQSIDTLANHVGGFAARLEAIETVVGSGAATRRLDAVETSLRAIDQRLAATEDATRNADLDAEGMATARAEALDARLAAFDGELKTVQDKLAAAEQDVGDILTTRLGAVEANVGELQKIDRRPEKFFLAALQLRDLTRTSDPFAREVAAAQALAGDNAKLLAALKILAADANHGVATVAELRHDFTALVAPRLAALTATSRRPIAAQAWGWVQSLVSTGAPSGPGDRNAAVIALAARSLDQGQLEAAVHQLLLLEDEAALVAAEWLTNASMRLATDKAMATVMSQAVDQLAASN